MTQYVLDNQVSLNNELMINDVANSSDDESEMISIADDIEIINTERNFSDEREIIRIADYTEGLIRQQNIHVGSRNDLNITMDIDGPNEFMGSLNDQE